MLLGARTSICTKRSWGGQFRWRVQGTPLRKWHLTWDRKEGELGKGKAASMAASRSGPDQRGAKTLETQLDMYTGARPHWWVCTLSQYNETPVSCFSQNKWGSIRHFFLNLPRMLCKQWIGKILTGNGNTGQETVRGKSWRQNWRKGRKWEWPLKASLLD